MVRRLICAAVVAAGLLGAASAAAALRAISTFRGRTSQGAPITVRYGRSGHTGYVTVASEVRGRCRSSGGRRSRQSTGIAVRAHGHLPIPAQWHFAQVTPAYSVAVAAGGHGRRLIGHLEARWRPARHTTCTARVRFTATRRR